MHQTLLDQEPQLRVQINQIDYTLEPPGVLDSTESHPRVPVIRIYGASSLGETACVHVHQAYPYFFVEYLDTLDPGHVKRYTATLARSLNHALALSLKRNPDSPQSQYIRSIIPVKGVHFYGFHTQYSPFLKICLLDPAIVNRAAAIMQSGTIMATRFRTYESHLGFILQFMCDFNLYGCGWINFQSVLLRGAEQFSEGEECRTRYNLASSPYYCQSRVALEVDAVAPHILNRHQLELREIHSKLQIPAPLVSNVPLISSVRELWDDERKRRSAQGLDPSPEMPIDPSESKRKSGGDWVAEARLWDELFERIHRENEINYENPRQEWGGWMMSVFESVEAVWQREYRTWTPLEQTMGRMETDPTVNNEDAGIQVDIEILSSQEVVQRLQLEEDEGEGILEVPDEDVCDEAEVVAEHPRELSQSSHLRSPADPFAAGEPGDDVGEFTLSDDPTSTGNKDQIFDIAMPATFQLDARTMHHFKGSPLTTPTRKRVLSELDHVVQSLTPLPFSSLEATSEHNASNNTRSLKRQRRETSISHDADVVSSAVNGVKEATQFVRHHSYAALKGSSHNTYEYAQHPPSISDLTESLQSFGLPDKIYREPYYSNSTDVPKRARTYAGLTYHLKGSEGVAHLDRWKSISNQESICNLSPDADTYFDSAVLGGWEYANCPPSVKQTKQWLQTRKTSSSSRRLRSQMGVTSLKNIYGLGTSPGIQTRNPREAQYMSILSLEVFVPVNDGKAPDPGKDEIAAIFYAFQRSEIENTRRGVIVISSEYVNNNRIRSMPFEEVSSELEALNLLIDIVVELDPDIVTGWEVQRSSWGYVNSRALLYGFEFLDLISRAPARRAPDDNDQWGSRHTSTIRIIGRHVLNAWRIMRSEQNLTSYTLENVVFHVLRRRIPHFTQLTLAKWYRSPVPAHSTAALRYFHNRTLMVLEILDKIEFVTKTAEFARVFGVDFFSVISRGSQFKVESFMFRIAKAENYILLSLSKIDVGKQNAAECMPLIMEPMSSFYSSPLVVLDFQSLYPSVMIAYNYCYSTCLGRVTDYNGKNKLGVVDLNQPPGILNALKAHIQIAPNGVMYVKPEVRQGLLKRMLMELLETRVMVKQAMKAAKDDKSLTKVLNARQLGLKYICNVTYGYTSATYSGRMPAVEIADSIVQTGRETLEKAISVINATGKWGAKVVYGDTDSIFVYLPGKTKDQAFRIGSDIADTITALNPSPIKLKFEKVYHPCVLLAKKRYVGFKYENPDETEPTFDAKGIETVRRDGVLAQQKMTENCLKMLFRSQDLSKIKAYCHRSWTMLLDDRVSVRDYIFSKEVKLGTYSEKVPPPPGALVASRRMLSDPNSEPQYGERIPYVITKGPPGSRLVDRAIDPLEFLRNRQLRLDTSFYITRVLIPPLERIFNLVGADVRQWYNDMPKPSQVDPTTSPKKNIKSIADSPSRRHINDHFYSWQCLACNAPALDEELCEECRSSPQEVVAKMGYRIQDSTDRVAKAHLVCASCAMIAPSEPIECDSLDCPWFFARKKADRRMELIPVVERTYRGLTSLSDAGESRILYATDHTSVVL